MKKLLFIPLLFLLSLSVYSAGRGMQVDYFLLGFRNNTTDEALSNGYVETYSAGSNTLKTLYNDWNLVTPSSNPITLNASGKNTTVRYAKGAYKFKIYDSDSTLVETWDNLQFFNSQDVSGTEVLAFDYGTLANDTTLDSCITANTDSATIIISDSTWNLNNSISFPIRFQVEIQKGALLKPATGKTLTFARSSQVQAGDYQIFDWAGTGEIIFTLIDSPIKSIWFGNPQTDITFAKAESSCNNATIILSDTCTISNPLVTDSTNIIKIENSGMFVKDGSSGTINFKGGIDCGATQQIFSGYDSGITLGIRANSGLNPYSWGAKGTGIQGGESVNDTKALLAAIAAFKGSADNYTMHIPPGQFATSQTLDVSGISIYGAGPRARGTTIEADSAAAFTGNSLFLVTGSTGDSIYENFRMLGNRTGSIDGFRVLNECWPITMIGLRSESFDGSGYYFGGSATLFPEMITMINCHTEGGSTAEGRGIYITEGQHFVIENCVFEGVAQSGVEINAENMAPSDILLLNPWIETVAKTSGHGVWIEEANNVTIIGGKVNNYGLLGGPTSHGIFINNSHLCKVDGTNMSVPLETASKQLKVTDGRWHMIERMSTNFMESSWTVNTTISNRVSSGDILSNSKSQIFCANYDTITANSTSYLCPPLGIVDTSYTNGRMTVTGYMTMGEMRIESPDPTGAAATYIITLVKNDTSTAIIDTVSVGNTTAVDSSNLVEFVPGDTFSFKVVTSSTSAGIPPHKLKISIGCLF